MKTTTKVMLGAVLLSLSAGCAGSEAGGGEIARQPATTESAAADARRDEATPAGASTEVPGSTTPPPPPGTEESEEHEEPPPAPSCADRTGGAMITLNIDGEALTIWSTSEKFNQQAFKAALEGTAVQLVFTDLNDGVDCDGQWSWHPTASELFIDEGYDAECDASPSKVEADKATWLEADRYCPSKVMIAQYTTR